MPRIKLTTLDARIGLVPIGPRCALSEAATHNLGQWSGRVEKRARACAATWVPKKDVEDVVQSALTRLLEACTDFHEPRPFPKTEAGFRKLFLTIVANLARDYKRAGHNAERSTHKFWGEPEPHLPQKHVADRSLAPDTESLWLDDVDPDEEVSGPVLRVPRRVAYDCPPDEHKIHYMEFAQFIDDKLLELPPKQAAVIKGIVFDGLSRSKVAKRLHISPKTVDTHYARAVAHLQRSLICWLPKDAYDDNRWRDVIKAMWQDMLVEKERRARNRSNPGREPGVA